MKILLTGAAGFIGFHLSKELLKRGHKVIGIDNYNKYYSTKYKKLRIKILKKKKKFIFFNFDLNKLTKNIKKIKKHKIDAIYHLASQPGIMYSFKNPKSYFKM